MTFEYIIVCCIYQCLNVTCRTIAIRIMCCSIQECLVPYEELFTMVLRWRKDEKHWMDGDFMALDPDFIDTETEELARLVII